MLILVLNCGSSSLKYQVLDLAGEPKLLCKGLAENIAEGDKGHIVHKTDDGRDKVEKHLPLANHDVAIQEVLELITSPTAGVVQAITEIDAVGHRVVHGGERFASSVQITPEVIAALEEFSELAPLHNPANLMGIRAITRLLPKVVQVGVFDTAFHQTMPAHAYLYALPYAMYEDLKIRKYGFHGTSHAYVAGRAQAMLAEAGRPADRIITCHLGNGASIAAIHKGQSVDTSMGFTPVDGLVMGTRTGDVDPGAVAYMAKKLALAPEQVDKVINKQSGMLGLSGISNDMRAIEQAAQQGDAQAILAEL